MSKRQADLGAIVRAAIEADPRSLPVLAQAAGLDKAVVFRFATGERDVTLASASKLAGALGLVLVPARTKRSAQPGRRSRKGR